MSLFPPVGTICNSASPWASSFDDLSALYACINTQAVTTRTATLNGFAEDRSLHQVSSTSTTLHALSSVNLISYRLLSLVREVNLLSTVMDTLHFLYQIILTGLKLYSTLIYLRRQ